MFGVEVIKWNDFRGGGGWGQGEGRLSGIVVYAST